MLICDTCAITAVQCTVYKGQGLLIQ